MEPDEAQESALQLNSASCRVLPELRWEGPKTYHVCPCLSKRWPVDGDRGQG